MVNRKRCIGLNQSAVGTFDWAECPYAKQLVVSARDANNVMAMDGSASERSTGNESGAFLTTPVPLYRLYRL